MNITEKALKEYAIKHSQEIVIRTYVNGNSNDERRNSTEAESAIIESIIFGGLLAIRFRQGEGSQGVIDTCEFIGNLQLPDMNSYDTIYNPLKNWCFENL